MRKLLYLGFLLTFISFVSFGQESVTGSQDTVQTVQQAEPTPPPAQKKPKKKTAQMGKRLYFGGNVVFNVGSYTRIGIYPMVGFKLLPINPGNPFSVWESLPVSDEIPDAGFLIIKGLFIFLRAGLSLGVEGAVTR